MCYITPSGLIFFCLLFSIIISALRAYTVSASSFTPQTSPIFVFIFCSNISIKRLLATFNFKLKITNYDCFIVICIFPIILQISSASLIKLSDISIVKYSVAFKSFIQYKVSLASLYAMESFEIKSAFD